MEGIWPGRDYSYHVAALLIAHLLVELTLGAVGSRI